MYRFHHQCQSHHQREDLVQLIWDIESYPDFLPWCKSASIIDRSENHMVAELKISFAGISKKYISEVEKREVDQSTIIEAVAVSGPFKNLHSKWTISEHQIEFEIEFEFESPLVNTMLSPVFGIACDQMIHAFQARADEIFTSHE